jgi:surface polysaccharide O-acyltransferase-like enzyme
VSFALQKVPIKFLTFAAVALMLAASGLDAPQVVCDIAYGLVYFCLGRLVYTKRLSDLSRSAVILAATTVGFVIAASLAYRLGVHVRLEIVGTLIGLAAFFQLSQALAGTALKRPLVIVGRCTMGIYVMHIFVIAAFRAFGTKVLYLGPSGIVLGCTVLAVLLPLAAQVIANLLGFAKFVGLKTKLDDVLWQRTAAELKPA